MRQLRHGWHHRVPLLRCPSSHRHLQFHDNRKGIREERWGKNLKLCSSKRFKVLKPQTKIRMSANTKISLRSVETHTVNNEPACLHKRTGRRLLDCIYGSFNEFRDVLHPHCPPSLSNLRHRSAHVHKLKLVDPTFPLQHCHIAKYFTAF